jgi:hypothetical protein
VSKDRVISLNQVIHWAVKPSSRAQDSSKTLDLVNSKVVYLLTLKSKEDERKAGFKAYIVGWLFVFPIPAATAGARNSWILW